MRCRYLGQKKKKKLVFKSVLMYASFLQRTLINISSFKPTVWSGTGWGSKVTSLFQLPPWWSTALWSAGEVISAVSNSAAHSLAFSNSYTPLQVGHTHVYLIVRRWFCNVTSAEAPSVLIQIFGPEPCTESVTVGCIALRAVQLDSKKARKSAVNSNNLRSAAMVIYSWELLFNCKSLHTYMLDKFSRNQRITRTHQGISYASLSDREHYLLCLWGAAVICCSEDCS